MATTGATPNTLDEATAAEATAALSSSETTPAPFLPAFTQSPRKFKPSLLARARSNSEDSVLRGLQERGEMVSPRASLNNAETATSRTSTDGNQGQTILRKKV